jgi:hypothetical protein
LHDNDGEPYRCSLCAKDQRQVRKMIAGPDVAICDECVALCAEICDEELLDWPGSGLVEEQRGGGRLPIVGLR